MAQNAPEIYDFGAYALEVDERRLVCRGESVRLSPKTFDVLVALVRAAGRMVTREMLLEAVWAGTFVEEAILTVHISALRKVLVDEQKGSYIETVPKRGYRFVGPIRVRAAQPLAAAVAAAPMERLPDLAPTPELSDWTQRVATAAEPAPVRRRWRAVTYASILSLCALVGISVAVWPRSPAGPATQSVRSLAVLPFSALVAGRHRAPPNRHGGRLDDPARDGGGAARPIVGRRAPIRA